MKKNIVFLIVSLIFIALFNGPLQATINYSVESVPNVHLKDSNHYVSNPDGILTEEAVHQINQSLQEVKRNTGIEIAVVAIHSIGQKDARTFATELFNHWGIGKKEQNNGLLIQLVTEPEQRSVVFETGYGLEGDLPDIMCHRIQQTYMLPDMKNGDYSAGMIKGVEAVVNLLLHNVSPQAPPSPLTKDNSINVSWIILLPLLPFGIIFILLVAGTIWYFIPKKCPACGKRAYRLTDSKIIKKPTRKKPGIKETIYRCKACKHTHKERTTYDESDTDSGWRSRSRSDSSSDSSSGGGSWGGGSSGGGGAISRF